MGKIIAIAHDPADFHAAAATDHAHAMDVHCNSAGQVRGFIPTSPVRLIARVGRRSVSIAAAEIAS
jgi:hypothetical protein